MAVGVFCEISANFVDKNISMRTLFTIMIVALCCIGMKPCTSAIVSGKITKSGRVMMWKHRDTGKEDGKVERIEARNGRMAYVAVYDAIDRKNREAWAGMNTAGFAVMNTASYNLKNDKVKDKDMDKEGLLMTVALGTCRTVDDFERLLKTYHRPMCVEANFGVVDAQGHAAYFETNNYSYTRINLSEAENGALVRTNYSHTGRVDEGYGYIREANANCLLAPHIAARDIVPATFTEELSRSFYHSLIDRDFSQMGLQWIVDQDFIPRRSSVATIVFEMPAPGEDPSLATMWIGLGYPPCSEIRAVWCTPDGLPDELRGTLPNGHSPLCDRTVEMKHKVFPIQRGNGQSYLNISLLYNEQGTGYCQIMKQKNLLYYQTVYEELDRRRKALVNK